MNVFHLFQPATFIFVCSITMYFAHLLNSSWKDLRSYFFYIIEHWTICRVLPTVRGTHFKIAIGLGREKRSAFKEDGIWKLGSDSVGNMMTGLSTSSIFWQTQKMCGSMFAYCFVIFILIVGFFFFVEFSYLLHLHEYFTSITICVAMSYIVDSISVKCFQRFWSR